MEDERLIEIEAGDMEAGKHLDGIEEDDLKALETMIKSKGFLVWVKTNMENMKEFKVCGHSLKYIDGLK